MISFSAVAHIHFNRITCICTLCYFHHLLYELKALRRQICICFRLIFPSSPFDGEWKLFGTSKNKRQSFDLDRALHNRTWHSCASFFFFSSIDSRFASAFQSATQQIFRLAAMNKDVTQDKLSRINHNIMEWRIQLKAKKNAQNNKTREKKLLKETTSKMWFSCCLCLHSFVYCDFVVVCLTYLNTVCFAFMTSSSSFGIDYSNVDFCVMKKNQPCEPISINNSFVWCQSTKQTCAKKNVNHIIKCKKREITWTQ